MVVYSLYVVNKAGGLIFNQDFAPVPKQSLNTYLRLASTFHGLHAICANLSPSGIFGGIDNIQTEHFRLQCHLTPYARAGPGVEEGVCDVHCLFYQSHWPATERG